MHTTVVSKSSSVIRPFFNRAYSWMGAGLALTAIIAYLTSRNEALLASVTQNWLLLVIAQFGIVLGLSFLINRISANVASVLFMVYSALTGLTFSTLFLRYSATDITSAFVVSAGMFGAMSLYGYATKADLSRFRSVLFMGLIGLVLAMIVNLFVGGTVFTLIVSVVGVLLFSALTAYDTQKLKEMALSGVDAGSESGEKLAVFGALTLYLDFINLFLFVLRLFGIGRSND
ncbi:Bax inhibitor-1/YccA family protein [Deinococcus pimensis]|uniref:Bax inhibitor-1/YccA family protein n=1 Tax=Deinococcus pimensis TaxID=309888 RepID=UPI0004860BEF|nr:Bax inhibitor-1/YccA family protein [Deinococcus pimensis]